MFFFYTLFQAVSFVTMLFVMLVSLYFFKNPPYKGLLSRLALHTLLIAFLCLTFVSLTSVRPAGPGFILVMIDRDTGGILKAITDGMLWSHGRLNKAFLVVATTEFFLYKKARHQSCVFGGHTRI